MTRKNRKIVIIGAGIAGLCCAVYARRCGYEVLLLEQHEAAGGLAASWQRGDYTFETCLHWLLGSHPETPLHSRWKEVFDIDQLQFLLPQEYARIENEHDESLSIFTNVDRMQAELLKRAPQDATEIRRFAAAVRRFAHLPLPDPTATGVRKWTAAMRTIPHLLLLRQWSNMSLADYGRQFSHPLLRAFFTNGNMAELTALAIAFPLAWMSTGDGGYPVGGSRAVIQPIVDNLKRLGGELRTSTRVEGILVDNGATRGVRLADGEIISADWVISAADGRSTIYDLLGGKYKNWETEETYRRGKTFPSYVQVSLGIARDLSQHARFIMHILDAPLRIDPATDLRQITFRFFHFDPTFAPSGKTAVTCFLPTFDYEYWVNLRQRDKDQYRAEKQRIANSIIEILSHSISDLQRTLEVVDVSTPATVIRITANWKGSTQGWYLTPGVGFRPLPRSLPGLHRFLMVGQWVMPGGGLPSGLMTARSAVQHICKRDGIRFLRN